MIQTTRIDLPAPSIGTRYHLLVHDYLPANHGSTGPDDLAYYAEDRVYIQASLHADELPGMLVTHHLLHMLDDAASRNCIQKQITVVPYANPIGLGQRLMGSHMGRFALGSGVNFNRDWLDVSAKVIEEAKTHLVETSAEDADQVRRNVAVLRREMLKQVNANTSTKIENVMKRELFKKACIASLVLDLHCDNDAVMHAYTHDRLWPAMSDLCALLDSKCNMVAGISGGNPFDEACSCPWAAFADAFPQSNIPMACQSITVELRGEADVSDELAKNDALNIYKFLCLRGIINDPKMGQITLPEYKVPATPLTGVDMIEATAVGVVAWKVKSGDEVKAGQLLGEIVNIEDHTAPRTPIFSRTDGLIFGLRHPKLAMEGDIVIKVAGAEALEWRKGSLLTAK